MHNNTINISENNLNIHKLEKIINSALIVPYTGIDYMKDAKWVKKLMVLVLV